MQCQSCSSYRLIKISGKVDDRFCCWVDNKEHNDYPPEDLNIVEGDYLKFTYCLNCGQIQNTFPNKLLELEEEKDRCEECGSYNILPHSLLTKYCKSCGCGFKSYES